MSQMLRSFFAWVRLRLNSASYSKKLGLFCGVVYALLYRLVVSLRIFGSAKNDQEAITMMTFGFIFVLPFCLGMVAVLTSGTRRIRDWLLLALSATGIALLAATLLGLEGSICLVMASPIYFAMAMVGALAAGYWQRWRGSRGGQGPMLTMVLILPLGTSAMELRRPPPEQSISVPTSIQIEAPAAVVWQQIVRVDPITEPQGGLVHQIGVPRPIAATLSHEGLGGIREASFERGLTFLETVDEWVPERALGFRIAAHHVPAGALDQHIAVGGRFFDVKHGRYALQPLGPRSTRLDLVSDHRISTPFNAYAALWLKKFMGDIQNNILQVVKTRSEKRVAG